MEIACFLIPIVRKGLGLGPPPDSRLRENDTIPSPQHRNVTPAQERHPSVGWGWGWYLPIANRFQPFFG